jgi:hypothetical protein
MFRLFAVVQKKRELWIFMQRNYFYMLMKSGCLAAPLLTPLSGYGAGSYDVCREPSPASSLHAGYHAYEDIESTDGALARENWSADVNFRNAPDWLFGAAYRATFIDESEIGFRTNGYLHSVYFPLQRLRTSERRFRVAIAPAMSASSNVIKDPEQYDRDAWQFLFAAVWEWAGGDTLDWRAGICADHRFGSYRVYPTAGVAWRPGADWRIELGFPDATLSYRPGDVFSVMFAIKPNGNEWYVKDSTLEYASLFEYRAWAAELAFTWNISPALELTAIGGVDIDAEYRGDLADGSRLVLDAGSVARVGIDLGWLF